MKQYVKRSVTGVVDSDTAIAAVIDDIVAAYQASDGVAWFDVAVRSSRWAGGGSVTCESAGTVRVEGTGVVCTARVGYRFGTWRTRSAPRVTTTLTRQRAGDDEVVAAYERVVVVGPHTDADDVYDLVDEDIAVLVRGPRGRDVDDDE